MAHGSTMSKVCNPSHYVFGVFGFQTFDLVPYPLSVFETISAVGSRGVNTESDLPDNQRCRKSDIQIFCRSPALVVQKATAEGIKGPQAPI